MVIRNDVDQARCITVESMLRGGLIKEARRGGIQQPQPVRRSAEISRNRLALLSLLEGSPQTPGSEIRNNFSWSFFEASRKGKNVTFPGLGENLEKPTEVLQISCSNY
jgi:hypothetical protein